MQVKLEYVSVGCNRVVNTLDWGPSSLISFGAANQVVIFDPQARLLFYPHIPRP
jgi:elongator complex protein 2